MLDKIKDAFKTNPVAWAGLGLVAALLFVVFLTPKARAEGLPKGGLLPIGEMAKASGSWTGAYVGVGGGYQVGDTGLSIGDSTYELLSIDGLSSRGWVGDVRVGFDWQVAGSPFVLGVLGGYNFGEAEFSAGVGNGFAGVSASITPTWYIGGRAGFAFGNTLAYVGYAYQRAEADGSVFWCFGNESDSASTTLDAHVLLAGLEAVIAPQITLGAEYSFAKYESVKINDFVDVDPEVHAFKVRLNFRTSAK